MATTVRGVSPRTRAAMARRLESVASEMTTAALARVNERHPWFAELDAEHRSWITVVAGAGIDGFVSWFAQGEQSADITSIFEVAPRALMRRISLHQTVDLVRTTIDSVETQIGQLLPRGDRPVLAAAIVRYSREVAFAAAEVYARAAEVRGAWDARLESLVVDAVVRGEADESVVSRASTLGWRSPAGITVAIGASPDSEGSALESLRLHSLTQGMDVLAAVQGDRLVVVLGGDLGHDDAAVRAVGGLAEWFGDGPIVVGPVVQHLVDAPQSARSAMAGVRAADAWPQAPRPVGADDLLPERALSGDGHARRILAREIFTPLAAAGGDLMATLVEFLDHGGSVEASARALFVHANTVRYRLKRIHELTGYGPTDPRDAYVLRLALTLGRLLT